MFAPADLPTPKRSGWTIAGSVIVHLGFVFALLILPVLSAFDDFVIHANNALSFTLPVMAMPVAPPAPAPTVNLQPDIKLNAAPTSSAEKPVTKEVTAPPMPGALTVVGGTGIGSVLPFGSGTGNDAFIVPPPPTPTPTPSGPVRPGGEIKWPTRTYYVEPSYPSFARTAKVGGTVYLEATIDANGNVRDVRVLKSIPLLDEAAKAAVSQWRYTPTRLNGVAVPVILTVTVTFNIR
jgi:protein TonB